MPECYEQFVKICSTLENHYRDMQDMEFTIEDKKLYMLQTRNGKRTATAALQIACDLVDEGMITEQEAGGFRPQQYIWSKICTSSFYIGTCQVQCTQVFTLHTAQKR